MITPDNYEYYLYQYAEGMLDECESRMVERFLDEHEELLEELSLYRESPKVVELDVTMPGKWRLKRSLMPATVWKTVAAACVALMIIVPAWYGMKNSSPSVTVADNGMQKALIRGSEPTALPVNADTDTGCEDGLPKQDALYCGAVAYGDGAVAHVSALNATPDTFVAIIDKTNTIMYDSCLDETLMNSVITTDNLIAYDYTSGDTLETDILIAYTHLPDVKTQIIDAASNYSEMIAQKRSELKNEMLACVDKLLIR